MIRMMTNQMSVIMYIHVSFKVIGMAYMYLFSPVVVFNVLMTTDFELHV